MSRGVDFTSNYDGGTKILRPGKKIIQPTIKKEQ